MKESIFNFMKESIFNLIITLYNGKMSYSSKIKDNLRLCIFTQLLLHKVFYGRSNNETTHYKLPRIYNYINKI